MNVRILLLAAALLVAAVVIGIMGGRDDGTGPVRAEAVGGSGSSIVRHGGKSHVRKPVEHRIATATISRIDHDWGFVVLSLDRGKFSEGHVGYLERRGENGGVLKIESILDREAVANIEQVESKQLAVGDLVLFSPDLVMLTDYNLDVAQVEWFSE